MKYAIEFQFNIWDDGKLQPDYDTVGLIGEIWFLDQAYDFDYEYWDWFKDKDLNPELKVTKPGRYHIFTYGDVSEDWSDNWEYGSEFEGFIFEPEYTKIKEIKE